MTGGITEIEHGGGGHYGVLYRLKTSTPEQGGPFGQLVRAVLLNPKATGQVDYLRVPETVEDIVDRGVSQVRGEPRRKVRQGCTPVHS
jgi:hypothetical protein